MELNLTLHLLWVLLQPMPHKRLLQGNCLQTAVAPDDLPLTYYRGLVQETEWATFRKSYSYRKEPQTLEDVKKEKKRKKAQTDSCFITYLLSIPLFR